MKRILLIVLALQVAAILSAGEGPSSPPPAPATSPLAVSRAGKVIRMNHLAVDLASRTIVMDANVCRRTGPLELLVCKFGTKEHESILDTTVRPADLHAALLMLGLAPGKPARWTGGEDFYRLLPPCGANLIVRVQWKDSQGRPRRADAPSWLKIRPEAKNQEGVSVPPATADVRITYSAGDEAGKAVEVAAGDWAPTSAPAGGVAASGPASRPASTMPVSSAELRLNYRWNDANGSRQEDVGPLHSKEKDISLPTRWVFVGSQIRPNNVYLADETGDMISVSNFPWSVIDVPFESTSSNAQLDFEANTDAIPPVGTFVEVVISPIAGAEKAADARILLEIDRLGRMRVDNEPIAMDRLAEWASAFSARHAKTLAMIRADGMALPDDIERAKDELRLGSIREFDEEYLPPAGYVMPRTADQARSALEEWKKKFANPRDYIREVGADADEALKMIRQEMAELDRLKALYGEFEIQLRQELAKYRASTRPAGS